MHTESALQRDELTVGILLVGEEKQSGVEAAGRRVDPVGVGVAAPQDLHPAVGLPAGEPDVGVDRDDRLSGHIFRRQVRDVALGAAGQRGAAGLGPAEDVLLIGEKVAVPPLDLHADPAGHQVGPAPQPRLVALPSDPDVGVHRGGVLAADVAGAVLESHQVAGGRLRPAGRRRTPETELRPAHARHAAGQPGEVPDDVEGHLGVVGTGLDADVAAAPGRVEFVSGQRREVGERGRAAGGQTEAAVEHRRTEADGDGERRRRQADRLTGVGRRRLGARSTGREPAGPRSSRPRQRSRCATARRGRPGWWWSGRTPRTPAGPAPACRSPTWWSPWNGTAAAAAGASPVAASGSEQPAAAPTATPAPASPRPPRNPRLDIPAGHVCLPT